MTATSTGATARVAPTSTSGQATFRPKARLMRTLGEEHISSQKVAIIELVKNAYDADATRVLVRFPSPLELGAGCIEVIDNGHGMSLETIQTTWMQPATIIKKRNTRSEERNRRVLGEKGIGRFATSRLANQLEIITRRADAARESRVCLDWRQFDDEKYLDEVQFFWETTEPREICPTGTIEVLWEKEEEPPSARGLLGGGEGARGRNGNDNDVWPYGELGNDWLGLDARHAQNPTLRLAHNQIVGYLLISADKNPQLRDQSNREGLIEGPAVNELREVIKMALSELETRRYNLRHENEQDTAKAGGRLTEFDLTAISDLIKERYSDDTELLALIEEKEKALKPQVEEAQKVLSRYHRLATLGQLILTLVHDGRTPVTNINHEVFFAKRDIRRAGKEEEPFVQHLEKSFDRIEKEVQVVRQFFKNLAPFGIRFTRRPRRVRLEQIIADAFAMQEAEIAKSQVCTHLPQTETWLTVEPTEIQTMIVNLLQNSLYWLSKVPKDEAKDTLPSGRQIMVQASRTGPEEVQILFSDSGPGVPPSVRDRIFEPYYSTKPDGMGLGLAIVGDIVNEYYDGSLELIEGGPLPGATFRITLRRSV